MPRRTALLILCFTAASAHARTDVQAIVKAIGRTLHEDAYAPGVDFRRWNVIARRYRVQLAKAKNDDAVAEVLTGALNQLGASHVAVLTPAFARAPFSQKGAGIFTAQIDDEPKLFVWRVFPESAAERAGVKPGDVILEHKNLYSGMDGTVAKPVDLKIRRGTKELNFHIVPRAFRTFLRPELDWVDARTAVLSVPTFTEDYDAGRIDRLFQEAAPAERLIIDLRYNGGGKPWNVEHLLGYLLPKRELIGSFISRADRRRFKRLEGTRDLQRLAAWAPFKMRVTPNAKAFRGTVAVLVNGESGSAAEVAAQALRELGKVPILGEKTAGAVLMSTSRGLPGGFELVYPKFDFVSSKGRRLEGSPVRPDAVIPSVDIAWPGHPDEALRRASAFLDLPSKSPQKSGAG